MSTIAERLTEAPDTSHGVPVGWADWRFVLEVLLPESTAMLVGTARVGTGKVAQWGWRDLTEHVRGVSWFRGADEFGGRMRVGVASLTLASPNGLLSTWNTGATSLGEMGAFLEPGQTVIRWGLRSATATEADGWLPQFCGHVESWPSSTAGLYADEFVDVTLVETVSRLALIDDVALPGVVGNAEPADDRIERLLAAAEWPYGIANTLGDTPPTMQSTDMSANRLAECYLTADSAFLEFRSDRRGIALVELLPAFDGLYGMTRPTPTVAEFNNAESDFTVLSTDPRGLGWTFDAPIVGDSAVWINDNFALRNRAAIGIANTGVTEEVTDDASRMRYGPRPFARYDLITHADDALNVARYTAHAAINTRARLTRRLDSVTIDADHGAMPIIASLELRDSVAVLDRRPVTPGAPMSDAGGTDITASGTVRALTHNLTPAGAGVRWTCAVSLDQTDISLDPDEP